MREILTIDMRELVDTTPISSTADYSAVKKEELTIKGPGRTLTMSLEKKVIAHLEQFEEWKEETISSGKPLNGIHTPGLIIETPITYPAVPQAIVLFENCDDKTKSHIENFANWRNATLAAGKPLNGVRREE